jgi:hypothetical protein
MLVLMVANVGYAHLCVKPLDRNSATLLYRPRPSRGTKMNWTNLIPGIPLFICLAILVIGFLTAEEGEE